MILADVIYHKNQLVLCKIQEDKCLGLVYRDRLGAGLQFGSLRAEDRFFVSMKERKSQSQKHNQQQQQQQGRRENLTDSNKSEDKKDGSSTKSKAADAASNDKNGYNQPPVPVTSRSTASSAGSNLERFLESTTPSVPAQYISKTTMRGWRTCDVEFQPYFTLGDLWEAFREWSAYGAGVPLVLDGSDCVVQYYVPFLSGIQLYGESTTGPSPKSRQVGEDSDGDYYRDCSSDGSSDYEFEKGMKFPRELHTNIHHQLASKLPFTLGSFSLRAEHSTIQEGFSSDDGETGNSRGHLLFEFFEQDIPYSREPLADKILDLSRQYPALQTLRSCDLLPISWLSVAWYPIYRIPTGPTLKDLDACFLTYHSLYTPACSSRSNPGPVMIYPTELDGVPKISLPIFGMTYKFRGSMWTQNGVNEVQLSNSLMQAAYKWLRLLQVNHPDFQFFASHGMRNR